MRRFLGKLAFAAVVLVLAATPVASGCGGDDDAEEARTTPQPAEPEQPLSPQQERGRDLFVDNCGSCHTLEAAGTQGSIGPDLDELRPDRDRVLAAIEQGPGAMPPDLVTGQEAEQVAEFVAGSGG